MQNKKNRVRIDKHILTGKDQEGMTEKREAILERLLKGYSTYFDVERKEDENVPLRAVCSFHVHSEKYVLVKAAKLWDADSNEYVYLFSVPELTEDIFARCRDYAYEKGMDRIDPKPGHMYSYITALFLCDSWTKKGAASLKKCRIYKNFRFSFHGWMEFHAAVLNCSDGQIETNHAGRQMKKMLENCYGSQDNA